MINISGRTSDGIRLLPGNKAGQGKGYLEFGRVDGDLSDRQHVVSNRNFHQEWLFRGFQSDWPRAPDLSVRHDGIYDKTSPGNCIFCGVGLVYRCATKREEGGGGRWRN